MAVEDITNYMEYGMNGWHVCQYLFCFVLYACLFFSFKLLIIIKEPYSSSCDIILLFSDCANMNFAMLPGFYITDKQKKAQTLEHCYALCKQLDGYKCNTFSFSNIEKNCKIRTVKDVQIKRNEHYSTYEVCQSK